MLNPSLPWKALESLYPASSNIGRCRVMVCGKSVHVGIDGQAPISLSAEAAMQFGIMLGMAAAKVNDQLTYKPAITPSAN